MPGDFEVAKFITWFEDNASLEALQKLKKAELKQVAVALKIEGVPTTATKSEIVAKLVTAYGSIHSSDPISFTKSSFFKYVLFKFF
jgi:hypothetical protein